MAAATVALEAMGLVEVPAGGLGLVKPEEVAKEVVDLRAAKRAVEKVVVD